MKVKQGFLLREIAGSWIVVPIGQRVVEFNGLMSLSESGAMLWKRLEEEVEDEQVLVNLITEEYDVGESEAREDILAFITSIAEKGLIER
jgi:hypothetical protein